MRATLRVPHPRRIVFRRGQQTTGTIVIGAGQAGLSLSRRLAAARHPHLVLERGRIGQRWSERWDSLTLLTPNWHNRLDGGAGHADRDGFLGRDDFVRYLGGYARGFRAPVREGVEVLAVDADGDGFRVLTDAGALHARNVVVATGDAALPALPTVHADAPAHVRQLHSSEYRSPGKLADGGVLVVGAGPSGQQIAAELRRSGRDVVLAAGRHVRMFRRYRGRDAYHWLSGLGELDQTVDEVVEVAAARRSPSLPLSGANGGEQLDLHVLQRLGVRVAGRVEGFRGSQVILGDNLERDVAAAESRLRDMLERVDMLVERTAEPVDDPDPLPALAIAGAPRTVDLAAARISTIVWATGYRRDFSWLHLPALDADGELVQRRGVTAVPGLYVLGQRFQHRRSSHFIGGVGADAAYLADEIVAGDPVSARRPRPRLTWTPAPAS